MYSIALYCIMSYYIILYRGLHGGGGPRARGGAASAMQYVAYVLLLLVLSLLLLLWWLLLLLLLLVVVEVVVAVGVVGVVVVVVVVVGATHLVRTHIVKPFPVEGFRDSPLPGWNSPLNNNRLGSNPPTNCILFRELPWQFASEHQLDSRWQIAAWSKRRPPLPPPWKRRRAETARHGCAPRSRSASPRPGIFAGPVPGVCSTISYYQVIYNHTTHYVMQYDHILYSGMLYCILPYCIKLHACNMLCQG